jgi:hypothetical protein
MQAGHLYAGMRTGESVGTISFLQAVVVFLALVNAAAVLVAGMAVRRMRAVEEIARAVRVTETGLAPRSLEQRFRAAMGAPPDVVTLLDRLVHAAEAFVTAREYAIPREDLAALRAGIEAAAGRPSPFAPYRRYVGDLEKLLAQLLDLIARYPRAGEDADRRRCLLGLVGDLLPQVRFAWECAIDARREGEL